MIKSIIVTLLFVGGSVSSLSCRGSISIKNDMMSIDLQVTKSNTDDDFDRFIEKSQASNVKSRIYLQIDSGKRIEINSETDHKPNYGGKLIFLQCYKINSINFLRHFNISIFQKNFNNYIFLFLFTFSYIPFTIQIKI